MQHDRDAGYLDLDQGNSPGAPGVGAVEAARTSLTAIAAATALSIQPAHIRRIGLPQSRKVPARMARFSSLTGVRAARHR